MGTTMKILILASLLYLVSADHPTHHPNHHRNPTSPVILPPHTPPKPRPVRIRPQRKPSSPSIFNLPFLSAFRKPQPPQKKPATHHRRPAPTKKRPIPHRKRPVPPQKRPAPPTKRPTQYPTTSAKTTQKPITTTARSVPRFYGQTIS